MQFIVVATTRNCIVLSVKKIVFVQVHSKSNGFYGKKYEILCVQFHWKYKQTIYDGIGSKRCTCYIFHKRRHRVAEHIKHVYAIYGVLSMNENKPNSSHQS